MGAVNTNLEAVQEVRQNISSAVASIDAAKVSVLHKYQQLGAGWNDAKYRELGVIVQECRHAFNSLMKSLLLSEKTMLALIRSIQEYEETNIGGSGGGTGSGSGFGGGTGVRAPMLVSPVSEQITSAPSDTYGTQLSFGQDSMTPDRYFSRGNHFDAYMEYWENESDYTFERDDNPQVVYVRARDIEGVYMSDREVADPQGFWTRHGRTGYSRQNILQRASHIQDVAANLRNGYSEEEIAQNPALSDCCASYFSRPVEVVRLGDFFVFEGDGRHRTLAAQTLDGMIPVRVTGSYVLRDPLLRAQPPRRR